MWGKLQLHIRVGLILALICGMLVRRRGIRIAAPVTSVTGAP